LGLKVAGAQGFMC